MEIGGQHTIARSLAATRMGGTVAQVGGVGGGFGVCVDPFALAGGKRLTREAFEHLKAAGQFGKVVVKVA